MKFIFILAMLLILPMSHAQINIFSDASGSSEDVINIPIPEGKPVTNVTNSSVNASTYWLTTNQGALSSTAQIDHDLLNNLAWSVAGHTFDTDLNVSPYSIYADFAGIGETGILSLGPISSLLRLSGAGLNITAGSSHIQLDSAVESEKWILGMHGSDFGINESGLGNALTIQSDGDIGINTLEPRDKLEVNGSLTLTNDSDKIYLGSDKDGEIYYDGVNIIAKNNVSQQGFFIAGDALAINGSNAGSIFINGDGNGGSYSNIALSSRNTGKIWYVNHDNSSLYEGNFTFTHYNTTAFNRPLVLTPLGRLYVDDIETGNVTADYFIGDGSFITNLNLTGYNPFDQDLNTTDDVVFANIDLTADLTLENNDFIYFENSSGDVDGTGIYRAGGNALRIPHAGYLIFDNKGTSPVEFRNDSNAVKIQLATSAYGLIDLYDTTGNNDVRLNPVGNSFFNGGNVGIGTISPSEKLEVKGSIKLTNDEDKIKLGASEDLTIEFNGTAGEFIAGDATDIFFQGLNITNIRRLGFDTFFGVSSPGNPNKIDLWNGSYGIGISAGRVEYYSSSNHRWWNDTTAFMELDTFFEPGVLNVSDTYRAEGLINASYINGSAYACFDVTGKLFASETACP